MSRTPVVTILATDTCRRCRTELRPGTRATLTDPPDFAPVCLPCTKETT